MFKMPKIMVSLAQRRRSRCALLLSAQRDAFFIIKTAEFLNFRHFSSALGILAHLFL